MPGKSGKVYILGAGPGDPELITVKALRILNEADAVVYDHLISLELLANLPAEVERYYCGKIPGKPSKSQEEINRLLEKLSRQGKRVIRLKGGDPLIFGRGGEEAIFLRSKGIDFEIIPGVTAGVAAPSSAGIPITHRGVSSFVIFLTAHEASDKGEAQVPYELISKMKNGSIVGYMGLRQLGEVTGKLLKYGMSDKIPVAVIEKGTLGRQKMISGNLKNIAKLARKNNLEAPALFVIGDAVSLRKYIYKASRKPLRGKRIMVTRAGDQAETMSRRLRILGAEVISLPTIRTVENFSEESWKVFKKIKDGWLIFTSENGVKYFFRQFFREGFDIRYLANFKIAVIGEGTEGALRTHRLRADFRSKNFTLQSLTDGLLNNYKWQGVKVVRVRSDISEIELEIALSEAGAEILPLTLYKTLPAKWDSGMITAFSEGKIDAVTFTSASTVNGLVEIIGADKFKDFGKKTAVISIGPSTTSSLRKYGVEPSAQAEVHSIAGVIKAILTFFK